jgi:hypothetical protein
MSTSGGGNGGGGRTMPRPQRQAAIAARKALVIDVKNMEKADRKAKQEQAKSKKKKRSTKSKGGGPAKRNNTGKKSGGGGCVGNNANVFPGHGQRLDSEPSTVADTKKSAATLIGRASINIDKAAHEIVDMSALIRNFTNQDGTMFKKLKANVARQAEVNLNHQRLASLTCDEVMIEVVKGGTKVMGGIMLGVKEDYENAGSGRSSGSGMDWKLCMATFYLDTRRGNAADTFTMYPKDVVSSLITRLFDEKRHEVLSEEALPSIGDLFWSMAYHFVLQNCEFEPGNLVDIYKEMDNGCRDWNSVHNLGERDARRKKQNYKGN